MMVIMAKFYPWEGHAYTSTQETSHSQREDCELWLGKVVDNMQLKAKVLLFPQKHNNH
jgi:hypothetical protein